MDILSCVLFRLHRLLDNRLRQYVADNAAEQMDLYAVRAHWNAGEWFPIRWAR